jgi:hypothetical protein
MCTGAWVTAEQKIFVVLFAACNLEDSISIMPSGKYVDSRHSDDRSYVERPTTRPSWAVTLRQDFFGNLGIGSRAVQMSGGASQGENLAARSGTF